MALREPAPVAWAAQHPSYLWIVVATVCIGSFMGQLDASVTQLILPVLERQFTVTVDVVSWVAIIYLLTAAVMLPIFGRLADMYGRKLFYTFGFLVFIAGSALCGFSTSIEWLIGFRALQAVGAAMITANSVAIVVSIAGPAKRGQALGVQAAVQAIGLCAGPALGGLILTGLDWRWVFWVNVPFGLVGAAICWLVLPVTAQMDQSGRFDFLGAALLIPGLGALMLAVNQLGAWGATSPAVIGSAVAAILLLATFIWWQHTTDDPLIPLSLFRKRAFALGNLASLLANAILFALFLIMPFAYERVFNESVLVAGLSLTAIPVGLAVLAPLAGALSDRLGGRLLRAGGMLVVFIGLVALLLLLGAPYAGAFWVTVTLAIIGIGQGAFFAPNNSTIMSAASTAETGKAGGIMNVTRSIGMSVGIAVAATLLAWQLSKGVAGSGATFLANPQELLVALRVVTGVLAGLAIAAMLICLVPTSTQPAAAKT